MLFNVRLDGFPFMAYQKKGRLPDAVTVKDLEREVTPGFVDREETQTIEVVPTDGSPKRTEVQTRRFRQRVTKQTVGHAVLRNNLIVEAGSREEAQAVFCRLMGRKDQPLQTSAKFHIHQVDAPEASPNADAAPKAPAAGKKGKPTADEAARALLGGKVPVEE
jgi:hypothetical protein